MLEMGADTTEWQDSENGQTRLPHANDVTAARARALASSCAPSREKRVPRPPSNGRWPKPSAAGSKSSGISPTGILPAEPMRSSALARELKGLPMWLEAQSALVSSEHHAGKGRPRKDATPTLQWHIQATVSVKQPQVEQVGQNAAVPDCHPERRAKDLTHWVPRFFAAAQNDTGGAQDDNEGSIRLSLTHELIVQYVRINATQNLSTVTFNQTWLPSEPF